MEKHFVTFCSPGTFVSETSTEEIESWDVNKAVALSRDIKERHGATPYGFYFTTRTRGDADFDSKQRSRSCFYWLGGEVRTAEQVLAGTDPKEEILRSNVECNGYRRIITNRNSWKFTGPMEDDDIVLTL